jgi:superfamily I DNA/RNA helicase
MIKNIERAVEKHGGDNVVVSTFTKAAAVEISARNSVVNPDHLGTLHSICYRALNQPAIAESKTAEWNIEHPNYMISGEVNDLDDEGVTDSGNGDGLLQHYNLLRSKLTPPDLWPGRIVRFGERWEAWKAGNDLIDYGDMIDLGFKSFAQCPGKPSVMFVDEAQDFNAAQFQCVRKWARSMERIVFIGDDDQAIYRFTGADARHMIDRNIPAQNRIILKKSWRLGKPVHKVATNWIEKCNHRMPKDFKAEHDEGEAKYLKRGSYKEPRAVMDLIAQKIDAGETCMLLASCSYMLTEAIKQLRAAGIIFHNPYKQKRGDWNPIMRKEGSTLFRISQFLRLDEDKMFCAWSAHNLFQWSKLVKKTGIFRRGSAKILEELATGIHMHKMLTVDEMRTFLEDGPWFGFDPWGPHMIPFLIDHAAAGKTEVLKFIARATDRLGYVPRPFDTPQLIVGTIHSVKGAEADNVFLFPDISRAGAKEWDRGGDDRDAQRRVFYVGMSRARKNLYIVPPSSQFSVRLF